MKKTNPYFVIISQDAKLTDQLKSMMSAFPSIEHKHFASVSDFFVEKCSKPLSGILVDFRLAMKLTSREREELAIIDGLVPYFKVRANPNGTLTGIGTIKFGDGEPFFKTLFEEALRLEPKKLRNHFRQKIHLNMKISIGEKFNIETSFKANSDNISVGGVFVISPEEWNFNNKIWIKFEDFKEIEPIECVSRWHLKWGEGFKSLPGYGLEFVNLTPLQTDQINKIVYQPWSGNKN